ncbi:hypothetical protein PHYSODRAFT_264549, partial [Phytophthora sojae]
MPPPCLLPEAAAMPNSDAIPEAAAMPETDDVPEAIAIPEAAAMPEDPIMPDSDTTPETADILDPDVVPQDSIMAVSAVSAVSAITVNVIRDATMDAMNVTPDMAGAVAMLAAPNKFKMVNMPASPLPPNTDGHTHGFEQAPTYSMLPFQYDRFSCGPRPAWHGRNICGPQLGRLELHDPVPRPPDEDAISIRYQRNMLAIE